MAQSNLSEVSSRPDFSQVPILHIANLRGEVLLVWTEGTGWQKGGSLAWQIFDGAERPAGEPNELPGIVAWSFAAAVALPGGDFAIVR